MKLNPINKLVKLHKTQDRKKNNIETQNMSSAKNTKTIVMATNESDLKELTHKDCKVTVISILH